MVVVPEPVRGIGALLAARGDRPAPRSRVVYAHLFVDRDARLRRSHIPRVSPARCAAAGVSMARGRIRGFSRSDCSDSLRKPVASRGDVLALQGADRLAGRRTNQAISYGARLAQVKDVP